MAINASEIPYAAKLDWIISKLDLDNVTTAAMRKIFILAEPGNNEAVDDLITVCLQQNGKVSGASIASLRLHGLVLDDGSIDRHLRKAVVKAVGAHYLELKSPSRHYRFDPTLE